MDKYKLEQLYQLEQRKKANINHIVEVLSPVIEEQIKDSIAWQANEEFGLDGYELMQFEEEILLELLEDIKRRIKIKL